MVVETDISTSYSSGFYALSACSFGVGCFLFHFLHRKMLFRKKLMGYFRKKSYICRVLNIKTMNQLTRMVGVALLMLFLLSGCRWVSSYDYSPYHHIFIEEEARLTDDASSPYLDFAIDYTCLNEEGDSIAQLINRAIQQEFLGADYANLVPQAAVDSFKNTYLRNYRMEVGELYQADLDQSTSRESMPDWYGQTYSLVTFVEEGCSAMVMNASANYFVDMGGAHPNQWSQWLNFDANTGKPLTKDDVFKPKAVKDIEQLLLDKLIAMQAELNPEEQVQTLEDLQRIGFLQLTSIYIPDNFLLAKDKVMFLFNRYDIAPYSAGEIVLEVPYEEIGHCFIEK